MVSKALSSFSPIQRKSKFDGLFAIGQRINKWVIINPVVQMDKYSAAYIKVRCSCGKEKYVQASHILRGVSKSCGCDRSVYQHGINNPHWKGVGLVPSSYITNLKINAKRRKIGFEITNTYVTRLYEAQQYKCALTGLPIEFNRRKLKSMETTASLDRIDSTQPYIEGNVQWVHKDINKMKSDLSISRFVELATLITKCHSK